MRLYNAGIYTSNFDRSGTAYSKLTEDERVKRDSCENFLESYHYVHSQRYVDRMRFDGVKVFLDSGAFSAYTKGVNIDIGAYCDYIHRNADIIEVASVLDAIGDADGTWRNQMEMERQGVRPLPCFHYGEPTEVLDYYVENYDYITIGGMVPISTPQLRIWLDRLWDEHLTHPNGTPKVKVHGFGLTSLTLMFRYPWYSVDSSTWVQQALNGRILLPNRGITVAISEKSPQKKQRGQHLDNFASMEVDELEDEIRSFGGDPDRLRELYYSRWAWNAWSFQEFARKEEGVAKFETIEQRLF